MKNGNLLERQLIQRRVQYISLKNGGETHIDSKELELVVEEPLSINIQGKTYSVIMRTPGEEKAHAAGFCLAEGVVDHLHDIADIALCDGDESNVAAVMLTPQRAEQVSSLLDRKGFVSQTSCGICGREIIEDLTQILQSVPEKQTISLKQAMEIVEKMEDVQELKRRSLASHAALIFNRELQLISSAEDAGRHNALDKAIGKLFLNSTLHQASIVLISSRASYEMIQKSARAGIEIVISMSIPTALACELGQSLGMTLVAIRGDQLFVFTGQNRIV